MVEIVLELRKYINILKIIFISGFVLLLSVFVIDLNRFTPEKDIEFIIFGTSCFLMGLGFGGSWILFKWIDAEEKRLTK